MINDADQQRRLRERAMRALRALKKEHATHGAYDDSAGKRYRIGVYFLLSGDVARAAEYFDWFEQTFPDDIGEPVQHLYSALAAHRHGEPDKARRRLLATQASNIYLLPFVCGQEVREEPIRHGSNWQETEYLLEVDAFFDEVSNEEQQWIAAELASADFIAVRQRYIDAHAPLASAARLPG